MKPHEVYLRFFSQLLLTVATVIVLQSTLRKAANQQNLEIPEDQESDEKGVFIYRECNIQTSEKLYEEEWTLFNLQKKGSEFRLKKVSEEEVVTRTPDDQKYK